MATKNNGDCFESFVVQFLNFIIHFICGKKFEFSSISIAMVYGLKIRSTI